jgi:hypothetical protein
MKKRNPHKQQLTIRQVREAFNLTKWFHLTAHASQRTAERNFKIDDIKQIILNCHTIDRHDTGKFGDPTARLIGNKKNGEWGAIAVTVTKFYRVVILTVMDDDRQKD